MRNDKSEKYREMAEEGKETWIRHGALEYYECMGNDLTPQETGGEKYKDYTDFSMPFEMKRMAYGGFHVEVEG